MVAKTMVAKKKGNRKVKTLDARWLSAKKSGNVKGGSIVKVLDKSSPMLFDHCSASTPAK